MKIHKAYKFRLYPNKEQAILINKTIGCSRFVYNHFLNQWNETYKETGKGLSYGKCSAQLPGLKNKKRLFGLKKSTVLPYNLLCEIFRIVLTVSSRNSNSIPASSVNRILYNHININHTE